MGIETVAVYSEADKDALHVDMADSAVAIGPAAGRRELSGHRKDRCRPAKKLGAAEAVHPGYGFLSEREAFSEGAGGGRHRFSSGPTRWRLPLWATRSRVRRRQPRRRSRRCQGTSEVIEDERHAVKIAEEIGFPVMIKGVGGAAAARACAFAHSTA